MNGLRLVASVLACGLVAAPALAQGQRPAGQLVDGTDPGVILEVAQRFGSAELGTDDYGDPLVTGRMDGVYYAVFFYGCTENVDCTAIQFYASWEDVKVSLEKIDRWNRETRFGKGYMEDEETLVLNMDVNLAFGVSRENLEDTFEWFQVVVGDFSTSLMRE